LEQLQKQQLRNKQQQAQLALSNKEKELQRLAYLKEKAEKQEKEKQLSLAEKEKQLQASQLAVLGKEKELQSAQLKTQQQEIATKNAQRNLFIAGTALMLLLAGSIFIGLNRTQKEKKKSDELLNNILPEEVAAELKANGSSKARQFNNATVLFTDFANFTGISESMQAEELVAEIDTCFKAFDEIIERNGLEKIKTIGDAYMAASGLPKEDANHATKATRAALEICHWVQQRKIAGGKFDIRIGLNSGPVVAGIVGVKKFQYDIWGDTVNTASRMESAGEVGKVNISQATYELLTDTERSQSGSNEFTFESRGKVEAKGKGEIAMYFVTKRN
jgi:class 3 adenylate cyclase